MDPDRDAIMARRRMLIALALSGMTTACDAVSPQPCLEPPRQPHEVHEVPPVPPTGPEVPSEPQACLSVVAPPAEEEMQRAIEEETQREAIPQPCLAPPPDLPEE